MELHVLISDKSIYFCKHEDINLAHECSSASRMDPSLETACLSSTGYGSLTDGKMIAAAPQGPGLGIHEPSVKANVMSYGASIIRSIATSLLFLGPWF